jgi:SHAQKYF class myb-like DNA-binding protein
MSSLNKTKQKKEVGEKPNNHNGKNFVNGRWTEKEHYLFLLAVKQNGRDWKKIQDFVKTRSSTQARSHAQKVLKDDLVIDIDEEISRLAQIYEEQGSQQDSSDVKFDTQTICSKPLKGPKGKRKGKCIAKEVANDKINQKIIQLSNVSSELSIKDEDYIEEENCSSEYSDYSSFEYSNTKIFSVEKVKKTPKRKRKAIFRNIPHKIEEVEPHLRKYSIVTSSSAKTAPSNSPGKTASCVSFTPRGKINH